MTAIPYVGVTGFKSEEEIKKLSDVFLENGFSGGEYAAMLGIIVSNNRLADINSRGNKSPPAKTLPFLLENVPKWAIPMMHYFTDNKNKLAEEVKFLFSIGGMYDKNICKAVQLNAAWPSVDQVEEIVKKFPGIMITLQIPKFAMDGLALEEIAKRARNYEDLIKWVLIDPSGGLGIDFDLEAGANLMNAIKERMPDTTVGIAGGFYHENVEERVMKLNEKCPFRFCIDAEGKLMENHTLVIGKGKKYIEKAASALLP